jgi:hypothetical protein
MKFNYSCIPEKVIHSIKANGIQLLETLYSSSHNSKPRIGTFSTQSRGAVRESRMMNYNREKEGKRETQEILLWITTTLFHFIFFRET